MQADEDARWIPVREVGDVRMGKQLSPTSREAPNQFPYLRVANVYENHIDYSDVKTMGFSWAERETFGLRPGDILLNEGQELHLVGRSAVYRGSPGAYCFQNTLIRFRSGPEVLPEYVQEVFVHWRMRGVFSRIAKRTNSIAHLGGDRFGSLLFPVVSLDEQQRIVEVIDTVSRQQRAIEESIVKLLNVRQALVQVFMQRIERGQDGVRWVSVGDLGSVRMGKQLSPDSRTGGQQFPYLRVANVLAGRIDYTDVKTMSFTEAERAIYELCPGDVLLNEGQSLELVGRSAVYRGGVRSCCFQNTLIRFRVGQQVLPEYAQLIFDHWLHSGVFAATAKKTTTIAHLGGDRFAKLKFPLISISAQRDLIDAVALCDEGIVTEGRERAKLDTVKRGIVDRLLGSEVAVAH